MNGILTEVMLALSNALLIPDIVLLLVFLVLTLVQLGCWIAEGVQRRHRAPPWRRLLIGLKDDTLHEVSLRDLPRRFGLFDCAFSGAWSCSDKALDDLQLQAERVLTKLALGIRLGPMLGLAGTLIPLGPALVALSSGDFVTLSSRLVIAFTSTVIGLFIGAACFTMHSYRSRWYTQDLNDIAFVSERLS